jgi:hypothetical protein
MTRLAVAYDRFFSERHRLTVEHAMVYLSIAGFAIHLLVLFYARTVANPAEWIKAAGNNYLAALYTPFSFILFYEVLMLVWALPESTTDSIAKQYEIISLIFIRGVFKAIADIQNISQIEKPDIALPILTDMGAGLAMFLLVTVFKAVARHRPRVEVIREQSGALKQYVVQKKSIALVLTAVLVAIAAYNAWNLGLEGLRVFYPDLFTVMIFTDVLVLILSLLISDRYELVFRNAAFIGSTILIRASLTAHPPYSAPIALFGMVFGILTLAVYNYHSHLAAEERAAKS